MSQLYYCSICETENFQVHDARECLKQLKAAHKIEKDEAYQAGYEAGYDSAEKAAQQDS